MAFGSIEFTTISRSQDYTTVKHNEDNKGFVEQTNLSEQAQKTTQQNIRQGRTSDEARWHQKNPDAKEKGNNEYQGDGGRNRKRNAGQQAGREGRPGFDMKI